MAAEIGYFLMTSASDGSGTRETQEVVTAAVQACGLPTVAFRSGKIPYTIKILRDDNYVKIFVLS